MSASTEVADLTAVRMAGLFRSGELSPVESAEAALDRIRAHNETVNAYCWLDEPLTLDAARESEKRHQQGKPQGPLDGVPVAIKDMFLTRGQPTLKGSKTIDPNQQWEAEAPAVAALRRQGAVPLGRTTTPEFGWKGVTDNPLTGITRNPWDPAKTPGGSSGGSAAAVALGMGPLALGTDAGGSIRIPAGFTGVVGHKPTHGRCPMWPPSAFAPLAHVGPMSWTVEDTALFMNVLAEPDARDATLPANTTDFVAALAGGVEGLRIAYSPAMGLPVEVDREIAAWVDTAAQTFEQLGATVEAVAPGFDDPLHSFETMFYGGAANAMRHLSAEQRDLMDPELVRVAEWASQLSLLDYLAANNERQQLTETLSRFHESYDLLLTPTLPIPAFEAGRDVPAGWPGEQWPSWTPFTYPFNLTGQPGCSVPCGFTEAGLPIGLQLVGARHADALVLRAAHAYQQAQPLTDRRPAT